MKQKTFEYYQQYKSEFENDFKKAYNSKKMRTTKVDSGSGDALSALASVIMWSKDSLTDSSRLAERGKINKINPFELSDETKYEIIRCYQEIKNKPLNKLKNALAQFANLK